jgi:hypothetical protein
MSFLQRVLSYVFNEVLVNGLANNRTFQRFAIKTTHMVEELSKKGAEKQGQVTDRASEFAKTFREEMKKGLDQQYQKPGQGPPGN